MPDDDSNSMLSSPSHRLPTISASQALQQLKERGGKHVTTGLPRFDQELAEPPVTLIFGANISGGYPKSHITEIYGPPASGKTALALHAAVLELEARRNVVWIDASNPLHGSRLPSRSSSEPDHLSRFHHYQTGTLAHLLALICHPPASFPPSSTKLLVLDGASSLFTSTYPDNSLDLRSKKLSPDAAWAANRRYGVMAEFFSKLTRFAAVHDLAVVLISQAGIRVRSETGALLRPAIWTKSWWEGPKWRVVVFRDFWKGVDGKRVKGVRFVGVVKAGGVDRGRLGLVVPFRIEKNGCHEIETLLEQPQPVIPVVLQKLPNKKKRKRDVVADSQSDESDDDLLDAFDRDALEAEKKTIQLHASYAAAETEDDPDLAGFEAAMDEGFEEI